MKQIITMKQIIALLAFNLFFTPVFSQGVEFKHGALNEIIENAKKENKIVFIDCYTTWCGPCKWMTKEIFPQKEVGDFFNEHFLSVKFDCEKGEGIDIAKRYGLNAYPTLLFIDTNGQVLHKMVGGKKAEDLINGAKKALDPSQRMITIAEKYKNGERNLPFVLNYINLLDEAYESEKIEDVSKDLVARLPIEKFGNNKEMFKVLANSKVKYNSNEYAYVLKNQDRLLKVDSTQYSRVINGAIRNYLYKLSESCNNLEELNTAIKKCKQDHISDNQDYLEKDLTYSYYLSKQEFDKWFDLKLEEANKLKGTREHTYFVYDIGDQVIKNDKFKGSKESIEKALKIAHSLADTDRGIVMGNLLLSQLYLKKGDKEKALKHYNIFFKANEGAGSNTHYTVSNLKKAIDSL